jgi:peroxiredoxin
MKSSLQTLLHLTLSLCLPFAPVSAADDVDQKVKNATLVQAGKAAPDFTGQTSDGRTLTLSSLKGKVVVLYFFATSVKASLTELQSLEKEVFQPLRQREDFQLIAIGRDHTREDIVKITGENKLTFPVLADPGRAIYARYFTGFVPRTVVISGQGTLAYLSSGYKDFEGIPNLRAVVAREFEKLKRQ